MGASIMIAARPLALAEATGAMDGYLLPVVLGALLLLSLLRAAFRRRPRRPRAGEVWFAQVPFADGTGSKDRPVLVLSVDGRRWTVARFTSQDRTSRRDHRLVPGGLPGTSRRSWADLRPTTLPSTSFRRRISGRDDSLVQWYARESASL